MTSRTVATAIDSPDSHEERFQRVRRAMQARPAVEALEAVRVEDEAHSGSEEHSLQASVRRSVDETEPLRPAASRAAFLTLDTIVLPEQLKKRPSVMKSVPHFPKGRFCNALRLALEEAVSLEIVVAPPTHVVVPASTGRHNLQGQVARQVPIVCQRRVVDVVGGK